MHLNMICPWTDSTSSSSVRAPRAGRPPTTRLAEGVGRDHRSGAVRRLLPLLGLHAVQGAAPRGRRPQGRWRLSVVESVGLPRLHDQPRGTDTPDDSGHTKGLEEAGATVVRGSATLDGPGRVRVGDRVLTAGAVVLAVGSVSRVPRDLPGLGEAHPGRTSRSTSSELPLPGDPRRGPDRRRAGPGLRPLRRAGRAHPSRDRVHDKEHRRPSELLGESLAADGVTLKLGLRATRVRAGEGTAART